MKTGYSSLADAYIWPALVIFIVPILCGCIITGVTLASARHDVAVWRGEFQNGFDQYCPAAGVDITRGAGKVYLDAYRSEYEWVGRDGAGCFGNGQTMTCSCPRGYETPTPSP